MPLHTLGVKIPGGGRFGITYGDIASIVIAVLFYVQPGVDHQALMRWIIDHAFFGSIAFCSMFGTFFSHKIIEWGGMGFYAFLYWIEGMNVPFVSAQVRNAKIDPSTPWDWNNPDKRVGEKYKDLQRRSISFIVTYHICVTIVQFLLFVAAIHWSWSSGRFEWDWDSGNPELKRADPATIPSKGTVAYQCLVSTFVAETGFYFAHRLCHETRLYYWHKRHHEYKDSTVYATFYVGLLDSILTDFIPAGFGIVYFEMHMWTVWMFTLPLILNALRVHCGYDNSRLLPLLGFNPAVNLPLCTDAERTHDMHHRYNTANYGGAYFIWDRLLGTWMDPDQEIADKKAGRPIITPGTKRFDGVQPSDDSIKKAE